MADFADCGMAVFGYGAQEAVQRLRGAAADAGGFRHGAARCPRRGAPGEKPRRAGSTGGTCRHAGQPRRRRQWRYHGSVERTVQQHANDAVLGMLIDPGSAQRAHEVGQGNTAAFTLGGLSRIPGDAPLTGEFTVERLGDGRFTCTEADVQGLSHDAQADGPASQPRSAGRARGARLAQMPGRGPGDVPHARRRAAARAHRGAQELGAFSRRLRADCQEVLVVKSPGPALADPAEFKWIKLRKGVRLRPLGPVHA